MTRRLLSSASLLTALALTLLVSACDFQAAEDAFDEFQIVIGLDPINSPVAGVVYDMTSGQPIAATLTFGGAGSTSLIDAYSDPLATQVDVDGGALTFGVSNSVTPSPSSPFTFTVTAEAPGYYTQSRTVTATEVGGIDFEVPMVPEVDANSRIAGTSSAQDSRVQANENGSVQQTIVIQTQVNAAAQATASATVSAGAVALSSTGQPLTGQLQTQIRAYDPSQGLTSLPQGATMSGTGTNQAVIGGIFFSMTDANGQSAATFTGSGSGKGAAGKRGAFEQAGGFDLLTLTLHVSDPPILAVFESQPTPIAEIWGYTPADGANNQLGSTPLTFNGTAVEGTIAASGMLSNVDLNSLGDVAQGTFFTLVMPPSPETLAPLNMAVTIVNPSTAAIPGTITVQGPGLYANRSLSFPGSTKTRSLAEWVGVSGDYFIVNGGSYSITVQPDGGAPETTSITDPSTGSTTINLSAAAATVTYAVEASFTCPAGTTFDVAVDDSSLDGVSVFYRRLPDGSPRIIPNDDNVVKDTDQSTYIRVEAQLSGIPGQQYEFTGVLDNSQAIVQTTAPAQAAWNITLDSDDVGINCGN